MPKRMFMRTVFSAILLMATGVSVGAQNGAPTDTAASASSPGNSGINNTADKSTPPPSGQAAKHVWTNEDVGGLRNDSPISTVGTKSTQKPSAAGTSLKAKPKPASFYRNQIAKLEAQLPAIDQQIAELQGALSGKTTDQPRKYWGVTLDDWKSELARLQKKKADIQGQISALEDQARHDGVPANALH